MKDLHSSSVETEPLVVTPGWGFTAQIIFVEMFFLALVGGIVTSGPASWPGSYYLASVAPVVALVVCATAWLVLVSLRRRTEIGADGIRNRTIRAEEFISWSEVVTVTSPPVGTTVSVVLRGGRKVSLAGIWGKRPRKGPTLEEITEAIRARVDDTPAPSTVDAPPMISRRLSWGPVLWMIVCLCVATAVSAVFAVMSLFALLGVAFFGGLAAFLVLATTRARTEVGPDGIRNRALGREIFTPWSDVNDATVSEGRYVRITRHDEKRTTLAAVRDGDVHPDGLGVDDIAAVIRKRAGLPDASEAPSDSSAETGVDARPLSLRPSRWPLLWIVPIAVATAVGWVLMLGNVAFVFFSGYVVLVPVFLFALAIKLPTARTDADFDGLRNRMFGKTRIIPWSDVRRFVVAPTLFGRTVQVVRSNEKRIRLAAPREGLLGRDPEFDAALETMRALAASHTSEPPPLETVSARVTRTVYAVLLVIVVVIGIAIGQPWLEPWWPTRHEADRLPRACSLVEPSALRRLVPDAARNDARHRDYEYSVVSDCEWSNQAESTLELDLELERRSGFDSGTAEARDEFASGKESVTDTSDGGTATKVPGLGDAAWRSAERVGDDSTHIELLIRHHNVVIELSCLTELPRARAVADIEDLARAVVRKIPIG